VGQAVKLPAAVLAKARWHPRRRSPATIWCANGENPFVIALRYKISLPSLLAANGLVQDAIIHPGQHLRILPKQVTDSDTKGIVGPIAEPVQAAPPRGRAGISG
jgi:hypothetical protein